MKDHSKPLAALVSNGMLKESKEKIAELADVEPEVFTAFCEYVYTGTYTSPFVAPTNNAPPATLFSMLAEFKTSVGSLFDQHFSSLTYQDSLFSYSQGKVACLSLWNKYKELCGLTLKEFRAWENGVDPSPVHGIPCPLFHAKLYVFSTKYMVDPLRKMCLSSIHRDLSSYMIQSDEICDLLEFVYRETGPVEFDGGSPLRSLLSFNVAARVSRYSSERRFSELLQSNVEISSDLIQKLFG